MKRIFILVLLSMALSALAGCEMVTLLFGPGPHREYREHRGHNDRGLRGMDREHRH